MAAVGGQKLAERHYDALIIEHREIIADVLWEAGILDQGFIFVVLRKVLAIDVLFAE
jgi:hypothetical protein